MASDSIEKFQERRESLNELVMCYAGLGTKRFYSLDSQAYRQGALSARVKELLGLVASFVLRCDDCIKYHVIRCFEEGVSDTEFEEALFIGGDNGDNRYIVSPIFCLTRVTCPL